MGIRLLSLLALLSLAALAAGCSPAKVAPGPGPSPSPTEPGPLVITSSSWTWPPPGPCGGSATTVTLSLTVAGARPGERVLVSFEGAGLPPQLDEPLPADLTLTASYTIPPGSGTWQAKVVSVGGRQPSRPVLLAGMAICG